MSLFLSYFQMKKFDVWAVPIVEMDKKKLMQMRLILKYITNKYNLNGKDLKDYLSSTYPGEVIPLS